MSNCIGWQSLVLFGLTVFTGFGGKFTKISLLQAFMIGVLGTFLMNVLRITVVALIAFFAGRLPAVIFHDYFSVVVTIGWLFFFWWFSYAFVLEERS
ncbi:hypothetical protein A3C33_04580 [Candidatus Curtissbacteria bacterium RIFCSPHIGHO2_02_FULL_42_58]|nr:MAG: hypothetical protein A3C33_04580 [Candidatus Curtissbacteria bacterium RIFCSPHIGHO2_02_FULL_42_58]OGD97439.1 MAG: hypothetical protein A3E71_04490 [Candidatus Curtissbacteria bacterium RIFCSPHIGHO2_12_FULL_42_33]